MPVPADPKSRSRGLGSSRVGTQCWPHFQALGWPEGNVLLSPVQLLLRTNLLVPQHAHNPLAPAWASSPSSLRLCALFTWGEWDDDSPFAAAFFGWFCQCLTWVAPDCAVGTCAGLGTGPGWSSSRASPMLAPQSRSFCLFLLPLGHTRQGSEIIPGGLE